MAFTAEFKFDAKAWNDTFTKLKDLLQDQNFDKTGRKQLLGIISKVVYADIMDHFEKEAGPTGSWQAWSQLYAIHMAAMGKGGNKILQDSGRLRNSFIPTNVRTQSGGLMFYNPATTSTGFPYAYAHDTDDGPRKKLPQRKFMWFSDAAANDLVDQISSWLVDYLDEG